MEPFNLSSALGGAPVITRSGQKACILFIRHGDYHPIHATIDGMDFSFDYNGMFYGEGEGESEYDLFMEDILVEFNGIIWR